MKNKGLNALEPLIGKWEYTMYNAWFLESLETEIKGFTTIERLHNSFLTVRSTDADDKPSDIWVIGYSDPQEKYGLFYYDQRGVSRIFDGTLEGKKLTFLREDKDFYQRMTIEMNQGGLHSVAEASEDNGKNWRKDLEMRFTRVA